MLKFCFFHSLKYEKDYHKIINLLHKYLILIIFNQFEYYYLMYNISIYIHLFTKHFVSK